MGSVKATEVGCNLDSATAKKFNGSAISSAMQEEAKVVVAAVSASPSTLTWSPAASAAGAGATTAAPAGLLPRKCCAQASLLSRK